MPISTGWKQAEGQAKEIARHRHWDAGFLDHNRDERCQQQ